MEKNNVYLFVFDGFSDWEPAYVSPEIYKSDKYKFSTFSIDKKQVKSAGGLTIIPDLTLAEISSANTALLIIPGGEAWEKKKYRELIPPITEFKQSGVKIAAICSGTLLIADAGILDTVKHTSNADFYLKTFSSEYKGSDNYVRQGAVADQQVITASGVYPVDFAKEIFTMLRLMPESDIEKWYQLFKIGIWVE